VVRQYEVIGKPVPRVDGPAKVTGEAVYAADFVLPGYYWGKSLLSPYPHARIARIDASAAKRVPGVHAVLTGADVRGHLFGRTLRDVPALAYDRVRYVGERVAAVAADDEDIAQQALDLIEVDYEELPAVYDVEEAVQPGAPILHPDYNGYMGVREPLAEPSNAYVGRTFEKGDADAGFAAADLIVERTYKLQTQHAGYMEPQAVNVWVDVGTDKVRVWACNKMPYRIREPFAYAFDVPEDQLVMNPVYIGGDFGAKSSPASLPVAYHLAKATGHPIKIVHDYIEELLAGNPNQSMVYHMRAGLKRDGTITAIEIDHIGNTGAYAGYRPNGVVGGANQAAGPYKIDNVRIRSRSVYTNTLPSQILRAPGEPQAAFVIESLIDEMARAIGRDPVDFRLQNLIETGDEMAAGERLEDVRAKETVRVAAAEAGYGGTKPQYVGRGVAIGDRSQGGGPATVTLTLKPDGALAIGTPVFDQGTGSYTTHYQVAMEELGVQFDRVEIERWTTEEESVTFDAGLGGSIQSRLSSTVAYEAAQDLKKQLVNHVAQELGWPEDAMNLRGEEIIRTDLEERVNWRELLQRTGKSVTGFGQINETNRPHFTSFNTQLAEVSVDPETGEVKLLKLITVHDTGQILNPIGHQGQINGGVVLGIGFAMMEEMRLEDGRITNVSLGDYKLPTMRDIPELKTVLLEPTQGTGPYGVKGIGELPCVPTAAAIANAVEDAIGVRIRDLPITAEKVYRALKERG
jgi:carbon-monoxide dehydrogenase large subunit